MREVTIQAFAAARQDDVYVIDVREPYEYVAGHVPGAGLMPMGEVASRLSEIPTGSPVYVVCASGNRSLTIANALTRAGYDAWSVAGGTGAWARSGLPIVRGAHADVDSPAHP